MGTTPALVKKGTYALLLQLEQAQKIQVGALGLLDFPAGCYLYVGSAHGPGGLPARLARHRRRAAKRLHWHIDYLRAHTRLAAIFSCADAARRECSWARAAAALPMAQIIARGFGSSDCNCPTHLLYYPHPPQISALETSTGIHWELEWVNE